MYRFSCVIVSWNVKDYLRACLRSIEAQDSTHYETIVVDNNSHDGSSDSVHTFSHVRCISLEKNTGFAYANNRGADMAQGEYLIFLNPDTVLPHNFFTHVSEYIDRNPGHTFFGPKIVNPDGSLQPSVRRLPTLSDQLFRMMRLQYVFPHVRVWRNYMAQGFNYENDHEVEQIMGACMVIRKDVFITLGGFDERFFLWFEEVDLCRRALHEGVHVWYTPHAHLTHYGGRSFAQMSPHKDMLFSMSLVRYFMNARMYFSALVIFLVSPFSLCFAYLGQLSTKRG